MRAAWGSILLMRPELVLSPHDISARRQVEAGTRVLGLRQLTEALVLARHPRRPPARWSIAVDAAHALTMLGLAVKAPPVRTDALKSFAFAAGLTALAIHER